MSAKPLDYLFVTNIPSPYQVDFFNALEHERPGSFHVIFCAASEAGRLFAAPQSATFSMEVLASSGRRWMKDWHRNPMICERLSAISPRMVIIGGSYFMPDAWTVRAHCLNRGLPWIYWGEDPFKKGNGGVKAQLKQYYLAHFLAGAAGAIGVGSRAAQSYAAFTRHRPTTNIPYSPNLERLLSPSTEMSESAGKLRRELLGSDDGLIVLFSGALNSRKAPELLLAAFESAARSSPHAHLVFAGDGPMRGELEQSAARSSAAGRVHFLGFLHGDRLGHAYLASDLLVLPSRWHEGWGVVVQEALAAGLPVIASDLVGASNDLIEHQGTGLRFAVDSVEELASHLRRLLSNPLERSAMSTRAREVVLSTGAPAAAAKFVAFAGSVLN
jgi:glycosyltransferase involved in cell wall biosynthesis